MANDTATGITQEAPLSCGHPPDKGHPATVNGKSVIGWRSVRLEDGREVCHACHAANPMTLDCGHPESPHSDITRGYGIDLQGRKICYGCCAENDRAQMRKTGKACLYLTRNKVGAHELSNWPGSLKIPVLFVRKGRHNIAKVRYDFEFRFEGLRWIGTVYGDNTQIAHCRRLKGQVWQREAS